MKCYLITIGNEILSGSTLDTNSHFIAEKFNEIGINIIQKTTISDEKSVIKKTLKQAFKIADLIITTGGLGPTTDDITKQTITDFFKDKLIENKEALIHVENICKSFNREVNELNRKQAFVPSKAKVIINDLGTAPCIWIQENKKSLICLPGVPYETEELIRSKILPKLKSTYNLPYIISKSVLVRGIPESILAEKLIDWEKKIPKKIKLAYLPSGNIIKLKLTQTGKNKPKILNRIDKQIKKLKIILGDSIFSISGELPEERFVKYLKKKNIKLALAESCTGGLLSYKIVSKEGASEYYLGSITSYSTLIKHNILNIPDELIKEKSVISIECAEKMAENIAKLMNADFGISTTGIAGPKSDDLNNKIGTAFVGIYFEQKNYSKEFYLPYLNRKEFINRLSKKALEFALEIIENK